MDQIEIYRDTAGGWRWRYVRSNGRRMAEGGEAYTEQRGVEEAILIVFAPQAFLDEGGKATFEWRDQRGDVVREVRVLRP